MNIIEIGTQLLKSKLSGQDNLNTDAIPAVLSKLIGNGDNLDIAGLVSALQSGGLASMASSWLGDGDNDEISENQVKDLLGADKVSDAATELGTDEGSLLSGLSKALPEMINNSSSGGSLLDSVGGMSGAFDMAKKLF